MARYLHRSHRDLVTVSGPDAATYLQGQLSQDVAGLAVGDATRSFVLGPQGKVDGWGRVRRDAEDVFVVDVDPGAGAAWEARLRRFLLRTKAEITVTADVPMLSVRGEVGDAPAGALAAGWPGIDGYDVFGDAEGADGLELDHDGFEALRIRSGVPRWGSEIDDSTIPATLGQRVIDASVSFTKGCYTGQELVARIDSRGGNVPRRLLGVSVDGAVPEPGAQVSVDGEPVGTITSSAPAHGGGVALAFIARAVDLAGGATVPATAGDAPARLVSLPFAEPR